MKAGNRGKMISRQKNGPSVRHRRSLSYLTESLVDVRSDLTEYMTLFKV